MAIDPAADVIASIRARAFLAPVPELIPYDAPGISIDELTGQLGVERRDPLSEDEIDVLEGRVEAMYKEGKLMRKGSRGSYTYYHVPPRYLVILRALPPFSYNQPMTIKELWQREFAPRKLSGFGHREVTHDPRTEQFGINERMIGDVLRYYTKVGLVERDGTGKNAKYQKVETDFDAGLHERRSRRRASKKLTENPKAPSAKRLISRCQRLWTAYCNNPTKARLTAVGRHLEKMSASSAKTVKAERARALRAYNAEFKKQGWKKPGAKRNPAPRRNQEASRARMQPPRPSRLTEEVEGTLYDSETGALVVTEAKPWTANRVADWAMQYMELGHADAANEIIRQYITLASGLPSDARKRAMRRQGFVESRDGWALENPSCGCRRNPCGCGAPRRARMMRRNPVETARWYMDEIEAADRADWKVTMVPGASPEELPFGEISYPIEVRPDELEPGNREILMESIDRVLFTDPTDPSMSYRVIPQVGTGTNRGKFWRTMANKKGQARLLVDVYRETLQESINVLRRPRPGGEPGLLIKEVRFAGDEPSKKKSRRTSKKKSRRASKKKSV